MPIRTPNRIVRVFCANCGWHLIINRGGVGDRLVGHDMWKFAVNQIGKSCPKCGCNHLKETTASAWDTINPAEYLRKLHYVLFHMDKKKDRDAEQSSGTDKWV